jgi:hypothetical protein
MPLVDGAPFSIWPKTPCEAASPSGMSPSRVPAIPASLSSVEIALLPVHDVLSLVQIIACEGSRRYFFFLGDLSLLEDFDSLDFDSLAFDSPDFSAFSPLFAEPPSPELSFGVAELPFPA